LDSIEYNACDSTNTLKWNPYIGWEDAGYYNIYDGNGNEIEVNWTDTFYTHFIEPGFMYSYIIKAVNSISPSFTSSSNIDSIFTTPIKKPNPNNFYINNINYNGSTASFTVNIDNTADLLGHSLLVSSNENSGFSVADSLKMEGSESIEFSHGAENQPLFYKVAAIGVCHDTELETKVVQPIKLETSGTETDVTLSWNESYFQSTSEIYKIFLKVDNSDYVEKEQTNGKTQTYQLDQLGTETSELFCFRIDAIDNDNHTSHSNEACVSRLPLIEFPNAFTPNGDGINDYFGPFSNYIRNVDISSGLFEFKLIIYDKYGGAIYESDNAFQKWTGVNNRASLKYVPEGAYIYYMWFKSAQGKSYEKSGTINVVYP
jgi:gliding motility-associated-like protein